jgi:hypothetical protein
MSSSTIDVESLPGGSIVNHTIRGRTLGTTELLGLIGIVFETWVGGWFLVDVDPGVYSWFVKRLHILFLHGAVVFVPVTNHRCGYSSVSKKQEMEKVQGRAGKHTFIAALFGAVHDAARA